MLDLYAGKNILWSYFDKERYFGVDIEKGKGKNLTADAKKAVRSLDLSQFNVIDCDSYGIPFEVIYNILNNETLLPETVIIYTAITNRLSGLNKECLEMFGLQKIYSKSHNLIAKYAIDLFHAMLYKMGIGEIIHYDVMENFQKEYGFFRT